MLTLRYKLDSGPFTNSNLSLEWRDDAGTHQWKPGENKDDKNLGGVPASLDNRSTVAVTDPGPLSRKAGSSSMTVTPPSSPVDWVKPRPEKDSQDWYFFVYRRGLPASTQ